MDADSPGNPPNPGGWRIGDTTVPHGAHAVIESSNMPSGDAQRVWFPEMVERLRSQWQDGLSLDALLALRAELDDVLPHIRAVRHIPTPVIRCRVCGATGREPEPHVSVRATIIALVRFGIASKNVARGLEQEWATHRQRNGLGLFSQPLDPQLPGADRCLHPGASDGDDVK